MVEVLGIVRSRFGAAILELEGKGWTPERIARHIGCDRSFVSRMKSDPTVIPRWTVGECLLELRDNVDIGLSKWGRLIHALRTHGYSTRRIAQVCRVTEEAVYYLEHDPSRIPTHDTGSALLELYRRNVKSMV